MRFKRRGESYIDPNDSRDFGDMTFDLTTEPDADMLLALPDSEEAKAAAKKDELTQADKLFFASLPGGLGMIGLDAETSEAQDLIDGRIPRQHDKDWM